tara:strand:- start:171 stop:701 length:531 start_codon:yes stop_codon:yes gene_type:complete
MGTLNVANVITDRITPTGGVPSGGGGGIIQIVEASTTSRIATSSSTYQATNLSCTITPKFSTSKIYITLGGDGNNNGNAYNMYLTYYRDIGGGGYSNIAPNGPSDTSNVNNNYGLCNIYGSGSRIHVPVAMPFLDSPATTSAVTYKVYIRSSNGTVEFPVNNGYQAGRMFLMEYSA